MIFLSLQGGKIVLRADGKRKQAFAPSNIRGIGEVLVRNPGHWDFITSSSLNHPEEFGFKANFEMGEIMRAVLDYAYQRLAVKAPKASTPEDVLDAAKRYPHGFPLPLVLRGTLVVFRSAEELHVFVTGMRFALKMI